MVRRRRRRLRNGERRSRRKRLNRTLFRAKNRFEKTCVQKADTGVTFLKNALIRHFDIRKGHAKSKPRNSGMRSCLFLRPCVPRARVCQQVAPRGRGDTAFSLSLLFTDKAVPAASRFSCLARITKGTFDCLHVAFACFCASIERRTRAPPALHE